MNETSPILSTRDLSIGHKKVLHQNLNLQIDRSELIVLLGENGRGKSTLLKSLSGSLPLLAGEVSVEGKSLKEWSKPALAEKLAVVWTENITVGLLTVEEFVAFGRYPFANWLAKMSDNDREKIEEAINLCRIQNLRKRDIQNISDGEKQKVLIARAISQDTDIIILDEPTTHLDLKNTAEIFLLLKKITKKYGKTILISTHKVELGLQIADAIWLLCASSIISGSPATLIENGNIQEEFLSENLSFKSESTSFHLKV